MWNEQELLKEFRNALMKEFIRQCAGNDYKKLTLLRIGDTIDRIYGKYSTLPDVCDVVSCEGRYGS